MRKYLIIAALLLSTFVFRLSTVTACTNFLVGKAASADGSTMISYAADSYGMYGFLHFSPAADYPAGAMREGYRSSARIYSASSPYLFGSRQYE